MNIARLFLVVCAGVSCVQAFSGGAAAQSGAAPPASTAPPPAVAPPPTPLEFRTALLNAANDLFSKAQVNGEKLVLVIDPLIDGVTGAQSNATQLEQRMIAQLVQEKYPRFQLTRFSADALARAPVVLIGTFTAINNAGVAGGPRDAYRICLALADMKTRTIVSKGVARALPEGIDATPTSFFADSPVFAKDAAIDSYIKSCQGTKVGDNIDQAYADRILVASMTNDAIEAYNAGRYREALDTYHGVMKVPGGEQLRTLNGIYLANVRLRRTKAALQSFGDVIDYGLKGDKLAVKFLFRPSSTQFASQWRYRATYDSWLHVIAERTAAKRGCLEVVGHTSSTGLAALNDRLSTLRAEYIKDRLEDEQPALRRRLISSGRGSREMLVATGKDDASDALDRRVELKTIGCSS